MRTALFLLAAMSAHAHRLDEYLQGTLLSVDKTRLQAQMTLSPGVAIFPTWLASIDADHNGSISDPEQRAYAEQVFRDLSLSVDGERLTPHFESIRFSPLDELKEGRGEVQLNFSANLPPGGRIRKLVLENHHLGPIAAYQVNCLIPTDKDIQISAQHRNYTQSVYQLDYVQTNVSAIPYGLAWLAAIPLLLSTRLIFLWRRITPFALRDKISKR